MEIIKVVLTGGPCAGKTTALNSIREYLTLNNIPYITVPETATELILNGMLFNEKLVYEFQSLVLKKQLSKEIIAEEYAKLFYKDYDKCVIIYDRGLLDNKAYLNSREDFGKLLAGYNLTEIDILDGYDLVLDLLSMATCKKEAYNFNNEARMEDVTLAIKLDMKTSLAWVHHRNLKVTDSSVSLEEETEIIINYIKEILSGRQIRSIRNFLLDDNLSNYNIYNSGNSEELYVTDYFLQVDDNFNYVISKREYNNEVSYVYSIYREESGKTIFYQDRKITRDEYFRSLNEYRVIDKIERREIDFIFNKQKYRLCHYEDYTTLELEDNKLNNELIIPDNLKIDREITRDNKIVRVRKIR